MDINGYLQLFRKSIGIVPNIPGGEKMNRLNNDKSNREQTSGNFLRDCLSVSKDGQNIQKLCRRQAGIMMPTVHIFLNLI